MSKRKKSEEDKNYNIYKKGKDYVQMQAYRRD